MADIIGTLNQVDAWMQANRAMLQDGQVEYLAATGEYWQGLISHAGGPPQHSNSQDGSAPADNLDSHPTDQAESWRDLYGDAITGQPMPHALTVDQYRGPSGRGYSFHLLVDHAEGGQWERRESYGPEDLSFDWRQISENPVTPERLIETVLRTLNSEGWTAAPLVGRQGIQVYSQEFGRWLEVMYTDLFRGAFDHLPKPLQNDIRDALRELGLVE